VTRYCRRSSIEMAPLQDETILFDPENKKFCVLNRTASFIWNHLTAPITTEDLATKVCQSFAGISPEGALPDADRTIQEMLMLNFVTSQPGEGEQQ
jgi:Coenzyme PQQ synthesis protein D (PqqD)